MQMEARARSRALQAHIEHQVREQREPDKKGRQDSDATCAREKAERKRTQAQDKEPRSSENLSIDHPVQRSMQQRNKQFERHILVQFSSVSRRRMRISSWCLWRRSEGRNRRSRWRRSRRRSRRQRYHCSHLHCHRPRKRGRRWGRRIIVLMSRWGGWCHRRRQRRHRRWSKRSSGTRGTAE